MTAQSTEITVSDVIRCGAKMTPDSLGALDVAPFGADAPRLRAVLAEISLSRGALNLWLVMHSRRLAATDDLWGDEGAISRERLGAALARVLNDVHRENVYVLAHTVQSLLVEVGGAALADLGCGRVEADRFAPDRLMARDLRF